MSDLKKYVKNRKAKDKVFAKDYESGYEDFKLGIMLRQARENAGLTQEELAKKFNPGRIGQKIKNQKIGYIKNREPRQRYSIVYT